MHFISVNILFGIQLDNLAIFQVLQVPEGTVGAIAGGTAGAIAVAGGGGGGGGGSGSRSPSLP